MNRTEVISSALDQVNARIRAAEKSAGRGEGSVQLLPVTKNHPSSDIAILHNLGITDVGENREQEARVKVKDNPDVHFHMIGQVQTKKANAVARWANACHSVDSLRLADALNRGMSLALERGDRTSSILKCFIQLSADGDTARGGIPREGVDELAEHIHNLPHLELAGLMVVPPLNSDAEKVFRLARDLVDGLGENLKLSAGMSGDLEVAINCGSDIVRVGTDILGARTLA